MDFWKIARIDSITSNQMIFWKKLENVLVIFLVPQIAVEILDRRNIDRNRKLAVCGQPQQLWNEEKVKEGPFSFSKKFCKIFVCGQRPDRNRNSGDVKFLTARDIAEILFI